MEKQIVNMSNWELSIYDNEYNLEGTGDYHPRLGKDAYISYTSKVEKCYLENDVLGYETKNTIYMCPLKYMNMMPYGNASTMNKEEMTHRADDSVFLLDKIISASAFIALGRADENEMANYIAELQRAGQLELKEKRKKENGRLIEIAKEYNNSIYIEVSQVSTGSVMAYHMGELVGVIYPEIHAGMIQDSIHYIERIGEGDNEFEVDFRYFPNNNCTMETYSWSDTIETVVIKNVKEEPIKFNTTNIEPGETKVFVKQA